MTRRIALPLEAWPDPDQAMWAALIRPGSPLDDRGALAHLKTISREGLASRYGLWLAWLTQAQPETLEEAPLERTTPERLQDWLDALPHLTPFSRRTLVDGVVRIVGAAWPDENWDRHNRLRQTLRRTASRVPSARKQGRVLSSSVLLQLGLDLAGPCAEDASTELRMMQHRRDGTMIAFLALLPMRRRAFSELALGKSVFVETDRILISLSEKMTKTGKPWEAAVPSVIEPLLRSYIAEVRPWLLRNQRVDRASLWLTDKGSPYDPTYLGARIGRITLAHLGVRVSPHLFRDAAATSLVRMSPENARLVRPLLGHSSFDTAERHYIHAQALEAGRDYAAVLDGLKGCGDKR